MVNHSYPMKTLLSLLLIGCTSYPYSTAVVASSASGMQVQIIMCQRDMSYCYARANDICRDGFSIIGAGNETESSVEHWGAYGYSRPDPKFRGSLFVKCGKLNAP